MAFTNPYAYGSYGMGAPDISYEDLINDPDFLESLSKSSFADANAELPGGMHVGGTYRAAHPLQAVAAIGNRVLGGLNQKRLNEAMARVLRRRNPSGFNFGLKPDPYPAEDELKPDPYGD